MVWTPPAPDWARVGAPGRRGLASDGIACQSRDLFNYLTMEAPK